MKYSILSISIIFLLFIGSVANSQEVNNSSNITSIEKHPLLSNNFTFYVGAYGSFKKIKVGANGTADKNLIDFSERFDFNNNEVTLFLNFNWRFARMWSLSSEYFSVKNGISKQLSEQIIWDDYVFDAGINVKVGFNLNMYRVMIGRTITKGQKHELGIGLGVHALDIETYIEGNAYINEENSGNSANVDFERRSVNALAPLPNVGAWYFYAPNTKWMLTTRVDWFGITVGDYSGSMWNLGAGANYQFHKRFGVGLKYRYFDFTSTIDKERWQGKFVLNFHGPLLTINANF
jgi:opacity protein-like surface antigen